MKRNWKTSTTLTAALLNDCIVMLVVALALPKGSVAAPQLTPSSIEDAPRTLIYVPSVSGGVTEINSADNVVFGTAPWAHGSNGGVAVTPDGSRMYVSNHDASSVSVFDTATNVPLTEIAVGLNPIGLAITPDGSQIYVANQNSDNVSVISVATNTVISTIPVGSNPIWVTISFDGSRAYISNQYSDTLSVIATASNTVIATIPVGSLPFHSSFTRDGRFLWVSAQGDGAVNVIDTYRNAVVGSITAGPIPRGIAFSLDGSRAYIADFGSNTVAVIDVMARALKEFISVGAAPWGLAMTPAGFIYVANFGSNTVSVIDSTTNAVVTTVSARTGPADVTMTSRARPVVLGYKFLSIAPATSPYSVVRSLNGRGDAVGDFFDASWAGHGFLRTRARVFTAIDPPGSTATSAFAVNDFGVIVGAFIDTGGILHGFQRSASGAYTTIDFPGAPDSQLTGINDFGVITGAYDLGNRASTRCPGPTCQAFSFLLRSGQFTPFADPAADPSLTFAFSINNQAQIAGLFKDPAGNIKGFVREPADGSFRTIQFPRADAFSYLQQINDWGVAAGEYSIRFEQGFLTDGTHFLSFDYPDSVASGLSAVNNHGDVGGFFITPDGNVHAYIAQPEE